MITFPNRVLYCFNGINRKWEVTDKNDEGLQYLGINIQTRENYSNQFKALMLKTTELIGKLTNSNISASEAHTIYNQIWLPAIRYSLLVASFSVNQLEQLQNKFLNFILPRMKYSRKACRRKICKHFEMGGLGILPLYDVQGHDRI